MLSLPPGKLFLLFPCLTLVVLQISTELSLPWGGLSGAPSPKLRAPMMGFHSALCCYFVSDVIICLMLECPSMPGLYEGRHHVCSICYSLPNSMANT